MSVRLADLRNARLPGLQEDDEVEPKGIPDKEEAVENGK
jgi:hypothetical protein